MKIGIARLLNRQQTVLDVQEELQFHIDMLERKYTQQPGMPAAAARTAASKRFGNLEKIKKQCVDIRRRNRLLRRVLKWSAILLALTGFSIHILASNDKVVRIGDVLIMIAICGRLLLYVRGLVPSTFLPQTNDRSLSLFTVSPKDGPRT